MKQEEAPSRVTAHERAKTNGQPGFVVLVHRVERRREDNPGDALWKGLLFDRGYRTFVLDGDSLRTGLCRDLGFCAADRQENVRRAASVSALMAEAGLICLTALISPFRADRLHARNMLPVGCFLEVYVNAPLAVCETRDAKGLYRRA
jgi:adenylylsulfate kinase